MSYSLEFEAEPFGVKLASHQGSPVPGCGCGHCAGEAEGEALQSDTETQGEWSGGGLVGSIVDGSRIIDLTAKADRTKRKGTRALKSVNALVLHQMACCASRKDPLNSYLKVGAHF